MSEIAQANHYPPINEVKMFYKLLQYVQIIHSKDAKQPLSQIEDGAVQIILPTNLGKTAQKQATSHELAHIYRGDLYKFNNDIILDRFKEPVRSLIHGKLPFIYDSVIDHSLYDRDDFYEIKTVISDKGVPLSGYIESEIADLIAQYVQEEIDNQGGTFKRSFTIPMTTDPDQTLPMIFDLEGENDQYKNGSHSESEDTPEIRKIAKILQDAKELIEFEFEVLNQGVVEDKFAADLQTVSIPKLIDSLLGDIESDTYETSIIHPSNLNPERFSERPMERSKINVVFDVSASMWDAIPYCLNILRKLNTTLNLICIDQVIRSVTEIEAPFRREMKISGNCGTDLKPAFNLIREKRWDKYKTLVITDGEFDKIKKTMSGRIWLIYQNRNTTVDTIPKRERIYAMNRAHLKEANNGK